MSKGILIFSFSSTRLRQPLVSHPGPNRRHRRMLGHRSIETIVRSHIHSFHFFQKEQLYRYLSETKPLLFSTKGLANLLDLTPRRVRQIYRSANIHFQRIRGKTSYSSKDVLLVLESYFSKLSTTTYPTYYIRKQNHR